MRTLYFFSILTLLSFTHAWADQVPNGCGPKDYGWLVPDSTLITQCKFKKACNIHDTCYSRCATGGDLEGMATCTNQAERKIRKKQCDVDFFNNISYFNGDRAICRFYGKAYALAVTKGGGGFFQGYERPEQFLLDISNEPDQLKELSDQIDAQLLSTPKAGQIDTFIIFKQNKQFSLNQLSTQTDLIKRMTKDSKQFAPMLKLQKQ